MAPDSLSKLLGLGVAALLALAVSWIAIRYDRRHRLPPALRAGYPPEDFPRRDVVRAAALATLCETQGELIALYRSVPAGDSARASLLCFLEELRALMDGAYAAALAEPAHDAQALSAVAEDAQRAARAMADRTRRELYDQRAGSSGSELERRLEVMRALAHDVEDL